MSAYDGDPVPVRDASTVVLVRDGDDGIEVFLQRRVKQMAFAGGMTVFPGGGVDPRDRTAEIAWAGPEPEWWAQQLSTDVDTARALVCAAVRETFEECGVLLAGSAERANAAQALGDPTRYSADRDRLVSKEVSFAQFLVEHHLVLRADLLAPLSHWITPKPEPRRYDTRFFLAALPAGQEADGLTTEAAETQWLTADGALAAWDAGAHFLLPPTWSQLRDVARFDTVADLMAAPRVIEPIEPSMADGTGLAGISFDGAQEYLAALADGRTDPAG